MARIALDYVALGQVTAPTVAAATVASLLGLTEDDDCLVTGVMLQADPNNPEEIYLGGMDASNVADAAQAKSLKLVAGGGFAFEADENTGDEDMQYYDLRRISIRAGVGSCLLNVAVVKIKSVAYNR